MKQQNTLPVPSPEAAAHSEKLLDFIIQKIQAKGRLTFAEFMQLALYAPGLGYYSAGTHKFGSAGDFVTAPEISPLFARSIAKQGQQILNQFKNDGDILELGAGTGVLAADILLALEADDALPKHYYILELSADLRQRQQALLQERVPQLYSRVIWLDTLPEKPLQGLILANEVLDAMPVHKFKIEQGIKEYYVTQANGQLAWHCDVASTKELERRLQQYQLNLPQNYESEINLALPAFIASLNASLNAGLILLIDYGFPRAEYYHPQRDTGTLMCHYRHYAHDNPLILPGLQDMTAHVDFTAIAEAAIEAGLRVAGFTNQANFLLNCGIIEKVMTEDLTSDQQWMLSQEIKKLTLPSEMGELFKVIALTKNVSDALLGFNLFDQRARL
jgi:SAM-dependent MidA family methyltransferase